jgi:type II secretory pathway pseudopilin PulG
MTRGGVNEDGRSESGDTLVEVLIALVVLGIAGLAMVVAFTMSISASVEHRSLATFDTVLRSASNQAISEIQQESSTLFANCGGASLVTFNLPSTYSAHITGVQYWNGSAFVPSTGPAFTSSCTANSPELITITVTSGGTSVTISTIVEDPLSRPIPVAGAATHLVFLGQPGNGTSGSPLGLQPIIAIEDAAGNIVTSDLSPVSVSITSGSGTAGATLSNNCAGTEFYGVVTFTNCSIVKAGTNYTLTATDGTLSSATSTTFNVIPGAPAQLVFSTQPGNGVAGSPLTTLPAVSVEDAGGNVVTVDTSTVTLALGTNPGGGTLSCGSADQAAAVSGVASFTGCSVNKAASGYTLVASDGTLTGATSGTFNIVAAAPAQFAFTSTSAAGAAGWSVTIGPITVQEQDAFGNPTTTAETVNLASNSSGTDTFSATSGGSSVTSVSIPSGSSSATFYYGDTKAGSPTITASGSLTSATQSETVTAGTAAQFAFTSVPASGSATTGSTIGPITVQEQDAFGNATTTAETINLASGSSGTHTFATTSGGTAITSISIPSGSSTATFYYGDTKAGTPTITASGSLTSATQVETVTAGSATKLIISSVPFTAAANASATSPFVITPEDAFGNPTTISSSLTVNLSSTSPGAKFATSSGGTPVTSIVLPALAQSVTAFYGDTVAQTPTLTVSGAGLSPNGTQSETITSAAATTLVLSTQPPASAVAGTSFTVAALVEDAYGNLATASPTSVTLSVANNPGSAASTCTNNPVTSSTGSVSFSCSLNKVGTGYTLALSGSGLTTVTTNAFNITAAAPSKFAFTTTSASGAATTGSTIGPITVQEQDAFGNATMTAETVNLASGSSGTHTFSATSGGSAITSIAIPRGSSSATFYYGDTKAGTPTITASGSLTSATQTETVTAGPATKLIISTQPPVSVVSGASFTTGVTVEDAAGNVVTASSASLNLAITASTGTAGASLTCPSNPLVPSNGVAAFSCSLDKVGTGYTLTASGTGLTSAVTGTVAVTVGPVSAAQSSVNSSPISVTANGTATSTVTVTLLDANGNPVSGKTVTLAQSVGGHSTISAASGASNASGVVTFTVKDTKTEAITYTGTDTTDALMITDTAVVTYTPGPVTAAQSSVNASPTSVTADGTATSTVTVTLLDANSNPVSGKTVTLAQSSGGHSTVSAASGTSNSSGVVTFTVKDTKTEAVTYTGTDSTDALVITATAVVTFTPGPVNAGQSTVNNSPASVTANGTTTSTVTVTLLDANDNPVSGKTVALAQSNGGHSTVSTASGASNASGVVTFTVTDTKAEAVTYTGTDTTDALVITDTAVVTFTSGTASAAQSSVNPNSGSVSGVFNASTTITVTLLDANGNPVSGKTVTLAQSNGGSSTISNASGTSNASGVVTFTVTDTTSQTVTYSATDTTDGVAITDTAVVSFTVFL